MTTNEMMNAVNTAIENNNTNTAETQKTVLEPQEIFAEEPKAPKAQMTLDAVLEGMNQDLNQKINKITENWQTRNEHRKETTIHETRIGYVMGSRGFIASASLVIGEGPDSLEFNSAQQGKWTNKINVLAGIGNMIKHEMDKGDAAKSNLVIYTQDSEARRISGMIKRINNGSNEYLTRPELEYVMSNDQMGDTYRKMANSLFALLKQVKEKGINVRVTGSDGINGFQLTNYNLPETLENKVLTFKNGAARFGSQIINVRGLALNGNHKIIKNNGRLFVERKVDKEKNPETYYALQLLQIISKNISVKADAVANGESEAVSA